MRIEYRRSGGVAGIDMTASVDTKELAGEQAQLASALIEPSSTPAAAFSGAPDAFSYQLPVNDGERTQTHHWAESEVPDALAPLLASLGSRARPAT